MKRYINLLYIACTALILVSCNGYEAPSYTSTFHRFATVTLKDGVAGLSIDYFNEEISLDNLKSEQDLIAFQLKPNDRILAEIAVRQQYIQTFTLQSASKMNVSYPVFAYPDSANAYFKYIDNTSGIILCYPAIWTNGHFLNFDVCATTKGYSEDIKYYLCADTVIRDTLFMSMHAYIPKPSLGGTSYESYLTYDMSSLIFSINNAEQEARRKAIVEGLKNTGKDQAIVKLIPADSVCIYNSSDSLIWLRPSYRDIIAPSISLDFLYNQQEIITPKD
ncbi:MAG: hypothetical protein MJY71_05135 [Bacteroidaceae bacterium]|nr:hypothetical protein [Bacteroidaceae bacterium]